MDGVKGLLQSRTFWGVFIAFAANVATGLGWSQDILGFLNNPSLVDHIMQVVNYAGLAYAAYGRWMATHSISGLFG